MRSKIKLLALDLDGTTVNHNTHVSERVKGAIAEAKARGVQVIIATGRQLSGVRHYGALLGVGGLAIAQQGGLIANSDDGTVLRRLLLDRDLACELVALERIHPEWRTMLYRDEEVFVTNEAFFRNRSNSLTGVFMPTPVADLCRYAQESDPDKVLFLMDEDKTEGVLQEVTKFVGDRATVVQSHAQFVEVNPLGADKGAALAWLAAHLGIGRHETMAVGDQHNDLTMIQWAGIGVAMGNARPDIKKVANWVAPTIDDDGVAAAIERWVLGM